MPIQHIHTLIPCELWRNHFCVQWMLDSPHSYLTICLYIQFLTCLVIHGVENSNHTSLALAQKIFFILMEIQLLKWLCTTRPYMYNANSFNKALLLAILYREPLKTKENCCILIFYLLLRISHLYFNSSRRMKIFIFC